MARSRRNCCRRSTIGSVGDSYDNVLAESVIGLFKTEVIRRREPWRGLEDVEFATLEWVSWYNTQRLLEPIGYIPPVEYEATPIGASRLPPGGRESPKQVSGKPVAVQCAGMIRSALE